MTFPSWLRGLTRGPAPALKKSRPSTDTTRGTRCRPSVERLEDRTLLSSYGLGFAFGLGSTGVENALAVATDASGNVLVAGQFSSASLDLDPGPGTYILPNAGMFDGFAAKYNPAGTLLWGVQVGGTSVDKFTKVAVDGAGNVLIAGIFKGSVDIGAPAAGLAHVTLTSGGSYEWFLAKIDPSGNALWATSIGTTAARIVSDITTDAAGNVYATGNDGNRLFVAKTSAAGAAVWTQVVSGVTGTTYSASGEGIAVDVSSNVYVTGTYQGKIDFNPDPNITNWLTSAGKTPSKDAFVLKLDANGTYVRAGSMGGRYEDHYCGIAIDGAGNVFVNGSFTADSAADFDPGIGRLNLPNGGGFVVKLDPNLNAIWGRNAVASGYANKGMAVDAAGNVYTTGRFSGTFDADPGPGTFNLTAGGGYDVLISKLNSAGNFVWAGALGGPGSGPDENIKGIAVDSSENVYTTGYFRGTADFDPGAGTYSLTSTLDGIGNPTMDAFVSKLVPLNALQAAGATVLHAAGEAILGAAQVTPLLTEALARWQAAGVNTSTLKGIDIRIADLPGHMLGQASGHTITLDINATGWGWFVDRTPRSDSEFTTPGNQGEKNRMDLLTVLEHELGHLLGHDHEEGGVMAETLSAGERWTPSGVYVDGPEFFAAPSGDETLDSVTGRRKGW